MTIYKKQGETTNERERETNVIILRRGGGTGEYFI